jgi:hypothetical protein
LVTRGAGDQVAGSEGVFTRQHARKRCANRVLTVKVARAPAEIPRYLQQ